MGQYYVVVNLDKREFLIPLMGKLLEHAYMSNKSMQFIMYLLSPKNHWYKTRIVWAGDYADSELFIEETKDQKIDGDENLFKYAHENFSDAKEQKPHISNTNFIVNHTKRQFVDFEKYKS